MNVTMLVKLRHVEQTIFKLNVNVTIPIGLDNNFSSSKIVYDN